MKKQCEALTLVLGLRCRAAAVHRVRVGSRKTDEQLSCGNHLSATVRALQAAEGRDSVVITVLEMQS